MRQRRFAPGRRIIVDGTPLDSDLHRKRGIGRYVEGLLGGLEAMHTAGDLDDLQIEILRIEERSSPTPGGFGVIPIERWAKARASSMHFENRLRLDRWLPSGTGLYHATGPEGVTRRTPLVATCHDLIPLLLADEYMPGYGPADLARRAFWVSYERTLRKNAVRVIAISDHVAATLQDRFRVDPAKIEVVHHGLADFWAEAPRADDAQRVRGRAGAEFVLSVGGFDPRKGTDTLVEALARLPRGDRPHLVVAGARHPSPILDRAVATSEREGLDVTFLDYVSDVELRWLYANCLFLAFASREEGWGLPILEAMAQSRPVLCANWGAMSEAAGGAAYTTDVADSDALAQAISELIDDSALRTRLGASGRHRIADFSWVETARRTVDVYRQTLGR